MKVQIDPRLLKYNADTLRKNVQEELRTSIINTERTAKEIVPKRTGALATSIHYGGSQLSWWAKTQLEYSDYIEEGTGPHIIEGNPWLMSEANNPRPLESPRRRVNHPGNPAYKYMETALYTATEDLEQRIVKALVL